MGSSKGGWGKKVAVEGEKKIYPWIFRFSRSCTSLLEKQNEKFKNKPMERVIFGWKDKLHHNSRSKGAETKRKG